MTTEIQKPKWTPDPEGQRVLKIDAAEIEDFERQVARFRSGEFEETEFMAFRLKQGVYGQRQPEEQMVRIKATPMIRPTTPIDIRYLNPDKPTAAKK